MKDQTYLSFFHGLFKKILLIIIGSGLISNAMYLYGLSYYEGFIESLGFEYNFFPINWNDSLLWTYFASREIGSTTISYWTNFTIPIIFLSFIVIYFIARLWIVITQIDEKNRNVKRINSTKFARYLISKRKRHPKVFNKVYAPLRWFLIVESSVIAFFASLEFTY